jgi:hypothetical protein
MGAHTGAYRLGRNRVATTTAITVIQVAVPANCAIEILRAQGGQSSSTTSTAGVMSLVRKTAAATVTSATPGLQVEGAQASKCVGGAALTGITASAEGTDGVIFDEECFNIVGNGAIYLPVPEEREMIGPSEFIALKHFVAPAGNWSHSIGWLEYAF